MTSGNAAQSPNNPYLTNLSCTLAAVRSVVSDNTGSIDAIRGDVATNGLSVSGNTEAIAALPLPATWATAEDSGQIPGDKLANATGALTLTQTLPEPANAARNRLYGVIPGMNESAVSLAYRKRGFRTSIRPRWDDISSRAHGARTRAIGFASQFAAGLYGTGGDIYPAVPDGLTALVRVFNGLKYQWRVVQTGLFTGNAIWMQILEPDNTTVRGSIRLTLNQGVYFSFETDTDPLGISVHDSGYFVSFHNDGVARTPFPLLPGDDHFSQIVDDEILQTALGDVNQQAVVTNQEITSLREAVQQLQREHAGIAPELGFTWYLGIKDGDGDFTEADFLSGSSSTTKTIMAPAWTGQRRLGIAYPNTSAFFDGLFSDGTVNLLSLFSRQRTGLGDAGAIAGVPVRVYAMNTAVGDIYGGRYYYRTA